MEDEEKFIRVLGTSVIALTKIFLPDMIARKNGKIMIVSSVAAFAPPSSIQALYGPIKTFMNRFSDSININYSQDGITSTALCPGFTVTEFHTSSGVQEEMDRVPSFMKFSAQRIAKEGVDAMFAGKGICVPTKTYKFLVFLLKMLPSSFLSLFERKLAPGRYNEK
jgi:short-subunit dehydrogenase